MNMVESTFQEMPFLQSSEMLQQNVMVLWGWLQRILFKDGLAVVLGKENYSKGVTLRADDNNKLIVDLYVIVGIGIKVSEVCFEIQKKVQYVIEKTFGEHVKEVNVFVQGVKGLDR